MPAYTSLTASPHDAAHGTKVRVLDVFVLEYLPLRQQWRPVVVIPPPCKQTHVPTLATSRMPRTQQSDRADTRRHSTSLLDHIRQQQAAAPHHQLSIDHTHYDNRSHLNAGRYFDHNRSDERPHQDATIQPHMLAASEENAAISEVSYKKKLIIIYNICYNVLSKRV